MLKVVDVLIQYSKPARTNVRLERKALLTMQGENKASAKFSRLTRKMRAEAGMFHREVSPEVMHYRTDHSLSITSLQGFAKLKLKLKLQHRQQPLDQTPSKPHSQPSRSQSLHSHNEPLRSHKRSPSKSVSVPFPFPLPSLTPPTERTNDLCTQIYTPHPTPQNPSYLSTILSTLKPYPSSTHSNIPSLPPSTDYYTSAQKELTVREQTAGLIKTTQDISGLIRELQELWLFGGLDTLREEQGGDEGVQGVVEVIEEVGRGRVGMKEGDGGKKES